MASDTNALLDCAGVLLTFNGVGTVRFRDWVNASCLGVHEEGCVRTTAIAMDSDMPHFLSFVPEAPNLGLQRSLNRTKDIGILEDSGIGTPNELCRPGF